MKSNQVQLFITCLPDTFRPAIGEAVVNILSRVGVSVTFPEGQTCCGQPAFNAGMRTQARKMALHTICIFERDSSPIVLPSGSCATMLRHGYLELFSDDAKWLPRAQAIAERTYEFTEYLVDVLGVTDLGASFPGPVTYHPSCHLSRSLGVDRQPRLLLSHVRDANSGDGRPLDVRELPHQEDCCGFGGVFSVEHPEISAEMLKRKIDNIEASGASTVVTADTGCLLHISGGLHRQGKALKVVHIAEILATF